MPAFEDDNDETVQSKVSLKTPQTKSMFDNKPKKPARVQVEQKATEINERLNSYPERTAELIPLFLKLLNNKTLPRNRTVVDADVERDIINKLMQLGLDMDEDVYEKDGAGSIGLSVLLMRCVLIQRDKINELEWTLDQLKTEVSSLKSIQTLDNKSEKK